MNFTTVRCSYIPYHYTHQEDNLSVRSQAERGSDKIVMQIRVAFITRGNLGELSLLRIEVRPKLLLRFGPDDRYFQCLPHRRLYKSPLSPVLAP
jgi:hypothetical protein